MSHEAYLIEIELMEDGTWYATAKDGVGDAFAGSGRVATPYEALLMLGSDVSGAPRREAALTLPVRVLSRLVGRQGVAHSSKNDEMRECEGCEVCELASELAVERFRSQAAERVLVEVETALVSLAATLAAFRVGDAS